MDIDPDLSGGQLRNCKSVLQKEYIYLFEVTLCMNERYAMYE